MINISTQLLKRHRSKFFSKVIGLGCLCAVLSPGLNAQQSYTFTNAGATGYQGPTQLQVSTAYALTNLNGSVTIGTQGIQTFTIPATGAYAIDAFGAQGFGLSGVGGRGAMISGEFNFTTGQVLKILVGQEGTLPASVSYNAQYGGGGGTFVTDLSNTPFVVAGGGGGNWSSSFSSISDAPITTAGNTGGGTSCTFGSGGMGGSGGGTASSADGGAGFTGDGIGTAGGESFVNGGAGGYTTSGIGGFGGGGGTSSYNNRRCGGGGGYSGGGAANGVTSYFPEGGGGGSYNGGNNQNNIAGMNIGDGKVIIRKLCNVAVNASSNPICIGENLTLSTNAVSPISWSSGGTSSSIVLSPSVTTAYTVTGAAGTLVCMGSAVIEVTVMPLPDITTMVTPSVLCVGKAATLTAMGADSYTWSSGPTGISTTVNPIVTSVYTVTGTTGFGCTKSTTANVNVNTNSLSVSANTIICEGEDVTVSASGAITYSWNTGMMFSNFLVSPHVGTVYVVNGMDIHNCVLTNSVSVDVNPKPHVNVTADKNIICKGESVTLNGAGAENYTWHNFLISDAIGLSIIAKLDIDIPYTFDVIGTDSNGCTDTASITLMVSKCTGISENRGNNSFINVYPNPGSGLFTVEPIHASDRIEISDCTGRIVASYSSEAEKMELDMTAFASGVYLLKIQTANSTHILKLVKE